MGAMPDVFNVVKKIIEIDERGDINEERIRLHGIVVLQGRDKLGAIVALQAMGRAGGYPPAKNSDELYEDLYNDYKKLDLSILYKEIMQDTQLARHLKLGMQAFEDEE
jgi:hypothetical protein